MGPTLNTFGSTIRPAVLYVLGTTQTLVNKRLAVSSAAWMSAHYQTARQEPLWALAIIRVATPGKR